MAHFAQLDENNIVINVIVVGNEKLIDENGFESEEKGIEFCTNLFGGTWIQTSYNASIRKNYAVIGGRYDEEKDIFLGIEPTCHPEDIEFLEDQARWLCNNAVHDKSVFPTE